MSDKAEPQDQRPRILAPDGKPFSTELVTPNSSSNNTQKPTIRKQIISSEADSRDIIISNDLSAIQNTTNQSENLITKFAKQFSMTDTGLIRRINEQPKHFINLNAKQYLESLVPGIVLMPYSTIQGIMGNVINNSDQLFQEYHNRISNVREAEKLLDGITDIYKLVKTTDDKDSKLMMLNYTFHLLKFIRFGEKKETLFSDKFLDFVIDEFKTEKEPNARGFFEQFLICYVDRLSSDQAKFILEQVHAENRLSSSLAQEIFLNNPGLKDNFAIAKIDYKDLDLQTIIEQRDNLSLDANNRINTFSTSGRKGKVGFEIEMKLVNEKPLAESFSGFLSKLKYFCTLDRDRAIEYRRTKKLDGKVTWGKYNHVLAKHYELHSYERGFRLNDFNFPILFKIAKEFSFNPFFVAYGANHIHVDKIDDEKLAPKFSIIDFRRGNFSDNGLTPYDKGWEVAALPLARAKYPSTGNAILSQFFDPISFYDQMQIVNGLYDLEVTEKDLNEFSSLVNQKEKIYMKILHDNFRSDLAQNFLSKFYIFYAKKYHREDLIPNILRAWKKSALPNISIQSYKIIANLLKLPDIGKAALEKKDLNDALIAILGLPADNQKEYAKRVVAALGDKLKGRINQIAGFITKVASPEAFLILLRATGQNEDDVEGPFFESRLR